MTLNSICRQWTERCRVDSVRRPSMSSCRRFGSCVRWCCILISPTLSNRMDQEESIRKVLNHSIQLFNLECCAFHRGVVSSTIFQRFCGSSATNRLPQFNRYYGEKLTRRTSLFLIDSYSISEFGDRFTHTLGHGILIHS